MKRFSKLTGALAIIFVFAMVTPVLAFDTTLIEMTYQGRLTDSEGNPLNGNFDMTFTIYDSSEVGTPLWTEIQSVQVVAGLFSVYLGSVNPIPVDVLAYGSIGWDIPNRWLEVEVGEEPISPRTKLSFVPYAGVATRMRGDVITGPGILSIPKIDLDKPTFGVNLDSGYMFFGTNYGEPDETGIVMYVDEELKPELRVEYEGTTAIEIDKDGITLYDSLGMQTIELESQNGNIHAGNTITVGSAMITIDGVNDRITASSGTIDFDDENLVTTGKVGIGTTSPDVNLDIYSNNSTFAELRSPSGSYSSGIIFSHGNRDWLIGNRWSDNFTFYNYSLGYDVFAISATSGNVGIGTTSPSEKVQAEGIIYSSTGGFKFPDGTIQTTAANGGGGGWTDDGTVIRLTTSTDSVGIGTATPTEKLDVDGNIHASGTITSGGSITIDGVNGTITVTPGNDIDIIADEVRISGKATIGPGHTNTGTYAFVAGENNQAIHNWVTIGGGRENTASGFISTVGGGWGNTASGNFYTTVAGGVSNTASGNYGAIIGGRFNTAGSWYSTVGGGYYNTAGLVESDTAAFVGGGYDNAATAKYATVGGGRDNSVESPYATVGGGVSNYATEWAATVGGGWADTANAAYAGVFSGYSNLAGDSYSDTADFVGGGYDNSAIGGYSTVGGGRYNTASGYHSTVPGGRENTASGDHSFATGRRAKANHHGAFVWADQTNADFASSADNQFNVRASGGVRIYSNSTLTAGVTLSAGASAWAGVSDSTRKRNIRPVNGEEILAKLAQLPISRWSYKAQDPSIEHIGPMAQDFYALFGLGEDNKTISTIDPDGIALAAIKELYKRTQELAEKTQEIEKLKAQLNQLQSEKTAEIDALKTQLRETNAQLSELTDVVQTILAKENDSKSGDDKLSINW